MKLIIKNNLTLIHAIDVKGKSGTGFLEVVKILKKPPPYNGVSSERYINALTLSGQIYGNGNSLFSTNQAPSFIDYKNLSGSQHHLIHEKILSNIYGLGSSA
jgi:hypothetical protein